MFREIIKMEMTTQKITRTVMAKSVRISNPSLSNYLNGKKSISSDTIEKMLIRLSLYLTKQNIYERNAINSINNHFEWTTVKDTKNSKNHDNKKPQSI